MRYVTYGGLRRSLSEWARHLNVSLSTFRERLEKWPLDRACTEASHIAESLAGKQTKPRRRFRPNRDGLYLCLHCAAWKPPDQYFKDKRTRNKLAAICKNCKRRQQAAWLKRRTNQQLDHRRSYMNDYMKRNRSKYREQRRVWYRAKHTPENYHEPS